MEYFITEVPEEEVKRQRTKAQTLRQSQWWKNKRGQGKCYYCGEQFPPKELTMDHIVPMVRGGKSTKGNIVPACKECNSKKKHMLPIEWQEYLDKLSDG